VVRQVNARIHATIALAAAAVLAAPSVRAQAQPRVRIVTDAGTIVVALEPSKAPVTVANFLRYVDEHRYDGGAFYRAVTLRNQLPPEQQPQIEVIQGGIDTDSLKRLPPIMHETNDRSGIKHTDGVISMARSTPGSASSEFFIVIGNQPSLDFGGRRNPDGQGFAAFGRVLEGMDVVRRIQQMPSADRPPQRMMNPVRIQSVSRLP
jgi:peptidyl-prolyl cis-trans isomerase A (cyclophilin A)